MDRTGWFIRWSVPLTPDLACIPGSEVFQKNSEGAQHYYLTASSNGAPGLLFASPDVLLGCANRTIKKRKKKEARRRKAQGRA